MFTIDNRPVDVIIIKEVSYKLNQTRPQDIWVLYGIYSLDIR